MRFFAIVLVALLLVAQGCRTTAPLLNVSNAPLGTSPGSQASLEDVSRAIWAAGKKLGWEIQQVRPGELTGTLNLRKHQAVVAITHDTSTFSINYRGSLNLRQHDGEIHRNYNNWVNNLRDLSRPRWSARGSGAS